MNKLKDILSKSAPLYSTYHAVRKLKDTVIPNKEDEEEKKQAFIDKQNAKIEKKKEQVQSSNTKLEKLTEEEAKRLYQSTTGISDSIYTLLTHLMLSPNQGKTHMTSATKDQLAVMLAAEKTNLKPKKGDKFAQTAYGREGELAGQDRNTNRQSSTGNALSKVMGSFGARKDEHGIEVRDTYDNNVIRLPKDVYDNNKDLFKGKRVSRGEDFDIYTDDTFDILREHNLISNNWIKGLMSDIKSGIFNNEESLAGKLQRLGENALVRQNKETHTREYMTNEEINERVNKLRKRIKRKEKREEMLTSLKDKINNYRKGEE
jgi:hypothetical protein